MKRPYPLKLTAIGLSLLGCLVYFLSSKGGDPYNYHALLASAFAEGRLDFGSNISWLELVEFKGKFYTVNPPLPAILLVPFTILMGAPVWQPGLTILLGGASIGLAFLVFYGVFRHYQKSLWGALVYGFGTVLWYHAEVGSGWYAAQISGLFFLWCGLAAWVWQRNLFLLGLGFSCAMLCRIPMAFSAGFLGLMAIPQILGWSEERRDFGVILQPRCWRWRPLLHVVLGIVPGIIGLMTYNYLRFGEWGNVAYRLWVEKAGPRVYPYGHLSLHYTPEHLQAMFTMLPVFNREAPFVEPSIYAMAIWVTTPAFLMIFFAKWRNPFFLAVGLAAFIAAIPSLLHGGVGYSQFGYRFSLDYLPYLMILTVSSLGMTVHGWHWVLAGICIAINLWGVVAITWLGQGQMYGTPLEQFLINLF